MNLTTEQEARIQRLSDTEIYHQAMTFASTEVAQEVLAYRSFGSQINGLLQFARSWNELLSFVKHQKGRSWQGQRQSYEGFYSALETQLNLIFTAVKDTYHLVPSDLSKAETREQQSFFTGLLARSFVQHLYAEMLYQKEVKSK